MIALAAVARLVKDVFDTAAGGDAVSAVSDYLRSQRVTSLADLQVVLLAQKLTSKLQQRSTCIGMLLYTPCCIPCFAYPVLR